MLGKKSKRIKFRMPDGSIITLTKILKPRRMFIANSSPLGDFFGLGNINISPLFDKFSYKEKVAIIYHELWHMKNTGGEIMEILFSRPWMFLYPISAIHHFEYQADTQGARLGGKKSLLSALKKLKRMIKQEKIYSSHEKIHPFIDDRIKRIKMLKV